jgi:hypothetical protein
MTSYEDDSFRDQALRHDLAAFSPMRLIRISRHSPNDETDPDRIRGHAPLSVNL